jgi:hypothetical protein
MEPETDIIRCWVMRETVAAWLLRDRDDATREAFFPKSEVSFKYRNIKTLEATAKGWNA